MVIHFRFPGFSAYLPMEPPGTPLEPTWNLPGTLCLLQIEHAGTPSEPPGTPRNPPLTSQNGDSLSPNIILLIEQCDGTPLTRDPTPLLFF